MSEDRAEYTVESMNNGSVQWRVTAFVHDIELEKVLNDMTAQGYEIAWKERNSAGRDGLETTTIVWWKL